VSLTPFRVDDVSIELRHVTTCCCRYVADPATTDDVKLIDARCIAVYHVDLKKEES